MRKVGLCLTVAAVIIAALSACSGSPQDDAAESIEVRAAIMNANATVKETVLVADPEGAVEAVYRELGENSKLNNIEAGQLEEAMGVYERDIISFIAYTSDAKYGLCDIAIIEPREGKMEAVREALMQYRTQRTEQFRNFDILNAYSIASGAVVFSQGDYVIMLMFPDNEAAQEILDRYLPPV